MIPEFIKAWDENKDKLKSSLNDYLQVSRSDFSYQSLFKAIVKEVLNPSLDRELDLACLVEIDHGHYQGTIMFVIPVNTYQPSVDEYYSTYVEYGSCSCCDTLESIIGYDLDASSHSEEALNGLMALCLHMVQRFKNMGDRE